MMQNDETTNSSEATVKASPRPMDQDSDDGESSDAESQREEQPCQEDDEKPKNTPSTPSEEKTSSLRRTCCPSGITYQAIPLGLCLLAVSLTFAGSWDCKYFEGANISFTGGYYGLWTMEDIQGECQLWDMLFFSYKLGTPLVWARIFSMTAMLMGIGLLATMAQALRLHVVSWGVVAASLALFVASIFTTNVYNLWILFWLFTFGACTLIARFIFIHPVRRRISNLGTKLIVAIQSVCALCCILTLVVLKSDFCTCNNLTVESLEERDPGNVCDNVCELHSAGIVMILACPLWLCSAWATAKLGIQPEELPRTESEHLYVHPSRGSILTCTKHACTNRRTGTYARESSTDTNVTDSEHIEHTNVRDDDEEDQDPRRCCQKTCFDYRIVPRSKKAKVLFWTFRVLLGILILLYLVILAVLIGARVENTNAATSPDTKKYFTVDEVCAFNPLDPSEPFETFPTREQATATGYLVAHCGACGFCSNPGDIKKYVETRTVVAKKAKECIIKALFGRYSSLVDCLEGNIGFSRDCTECWADNMRTTASKCLFTCMSTLMQGQMDANNVNGAGDEGWLNSCVFCDERRSGPGFVTCSGVARRRLGIASEINRDPDELCPNVDIEWLAADWSELFPDG